MKKLIFIVSILLVLFGTVSAQKSQYKYYRVTHYQVLHGDGEQDDTKALNAWGRGEKVLYKGKILGKVLQKGLFLITWGIDFNRPNSIVRNNTFLVRYTGYDSVDIVHFGRGVRHRRNQVVPEGY